MAGPKTIIIINILLVAVMIAVIAASAYGLGRNEFDKSSSAYQAGAAFLTIGVVLEIVFVVSLVFLAMYFSGTPGVTTPFALPRAAM